MIQCRVLQVSASGYHQHRLRQAAEVGPNQPHRQLSDTALAVHIKAVFAEMKGAYGWPRIWRELITTTVIGCEPSPRCKRISALDPSVLIFNES